MRETERNNCWYRFSTVAAIFALPEKRNQPKQYDTRKSHIAPTDTRHDLYNFEERVKRSLKR